MALNSQAAIAAAITAGKINGGTFLRSTGGNNRLTFLDGATGIPSNGSFSGTAGAAVALTRSSQGVLPLHNLSTSSRHLYSFYYTQTASSGAKGLALVDLLLYYPSCVVTGSPTSLDNTVTLPRYTTGGEVLAGVFIQTTLGTAGTELTLTYTDQANNSRTGTIVTTSVSAGSFNSATANSSFDIFVPFGAGTTGVKKIDSYTINSGGTTGTVAFVLLKVLTTINAQNEASLSANVQKNFLTTPEFVKIEDAACLSLISFGAISSGALSGGYAYIWD